MNEESRTERKKGKSSRVGQLSCMVKFTLRSSHLEFYTRASFNIYLCRGANNKSLAFPIFSATKIIFLGWVKEDRTKL
jgi:hypothetical protein